MADEIKAENVLTGKVDENISDLPYHNRETQHIAEERAKAVEDDATQLEVAEQPAE